VLVSINAAFFKRCNYTDNGQYIVIVRATQSAATDEEALHREFWSAPWKPLTENVNTPKLSWKAETKPS